MSMSVREELRTYSKGDLTRITVLATKKQKDAEDKYQRLRAVVLVVAGVAFGAGFFLALGIATVVLGWL